jgi:hypothetical protein
MASEIDICNLALSHLGDTATISSLYPPEGSAQAEHCSRFYPIARDGLLEMHTWNFVTRRAYLAPLETIWPEWQHSYEAPNDMLQIISILAPESEGDYSVAIPRPYSQADVPNVGVGIYMPQDFAIETDATGRDIILTNQEKAMVRYTARITDTTKFPPLFVTALSWYLASMLAGPIIKGDVGQAEAKRCLATMAQWLGQAQVIDSNQRQIRPQQSTSWIANR